uniref:F-box protein SKIP28 isoform X1 n=1 Tax=Elaeis guineensis var. tenera TaxID=51953 RepID=A0A6I9QCF4_ELAGV|nr:F-box protein SKIP28 isoform X1 [Elaeis guineensis]
MEHSLPTIANPDAPFPSPTPSSSTSSPSGDAAGADQRGPHGALFLVLGYLRLPELLAFQRVCRLFRDVIAGDSFLWQHIVVEPPLNGKLTDDALLKVTAKAEGKLKSLALLDCWKITDAGLLLVADRNPGITKLCVPGCITADGVVKVAKRLFEREGNLKHLQLRGICNITKEHLDVLNSFMCKNNPCQIPQPSFYSHWRIVSFNSDDDRPVDVDMCPRCKNVNLVFDCTRENCSVNCRMMKSRWSECRGCFFCIARCEECGGCIDLEGSGEKAICLHLLCLQCWLHLPKCNMCNQPYCKWDADLFGSSSMSAGFVCERCRESGRSSYHSASGYWETFA